MPCLFTHTRWPLFSFRSALRPCLLFLVFATSIVFQRWCNLSLPLALVACSRVLPCLALRFSFFVWFSACLRFPSCCCPRALVAFSSAFFSILLPAVFVGAVLVCDLAVGSCTFRCCCVICFLFPFALPSSLLSTLCFRGASTTVDCCFLCFVIFLSSLYAFVFSSPVSLPWLFFLPDGLRCSSSLVDSCSRSVEIVGL